MDEPNHEDYDYRALSLLAASDRVQQSNKFIKPLLEDGNIVISDRYFYSCLANLRARGYKNDQWIYEVATFIPKPDLSFFLDIEVETAINRVKSRAEEKNHYIDIPLQHNLRSEYIDICKKVNGILIDSSEKPDAAFIDVINKVNEVLSIKSIAKKIE